MPVPALIGLSKPPAKPVVMIELGKFVLFNKNYSARMHTHAFCILRVKQFIETHGGWY